MSLQVDQRNWTAEAFEIIEQVPTLEQVVAQIRDLLEIDHVVYHSSRLGSSPSVEPYIQLTYPASWIKRYLQMNYVDIDPVLREGFLRTLPFQWSDLTISTPAEGQMLVDALSHGVGPHGLSIPVRSKQGHRGLFSVSYSGPADQWSRFHATHLRGTIEIAHRIHKRVIAERFGESGVQLSSREVDCLFWTANGKDTKDIALILNISFHTARDYIKSAKYKLNSTTAAQAVTKAIELGLLTLNGAE
jgi:LuxR family transcriptional regulator, quorum-sensing system regulator CinR